MTTKEGPGEPLSQRFSLRRWSRRKLDAARSASSAAPAAAAAAPPPQAPAGSGSAAAAAAQPAPAALPPVESLTFESEFAAFLKPDVDEAVKRAALKQLFRDPRFNVMDRLDVYIDDYTQPDPIPAEMLKELVQGRYIFNPPRTELTPEGHVVDAPSTEAAAPSGPAAMTPADAAESAASPPATVDGATPADAPPPRAGGAETGPAKP